MRDAGEPRTCIIEYGCRECVEPLLFGTMNLEVAKMYVPDDANAAYVVLKLMDRGLTGDSIDRAMKHLVGNDWKEIRLSLWHKRLQDRGFIFREVEDLHLFIDEIQALVNGKNKLDRFFRGFNRPSI